MIDKAHPTKASEWLVALLDSPDDSALRATFDTWLAESEAHQRDWREIAETYEVMGMVPPQHQAHWSGHAVEPAAVPAFRPIRRRRALYAAFAMAAAACVAFVMGTDLPRTVGADAVTGTAEVRRVDLADGSTVFLGPESAIQVDYAPNARDVRLLSGMAYFEVQSDHDRPFRVKTAEAETTVLGTAFEVHLHERSLNVAVREGRVGVRQTKEGAPDVTLTAGEALHLSGVGAPVRTRINPANVASWLNGRLFAEDMPVADVVADLRRYHHGAVVVRGQRLMQQPLTGVYNLDDPASALEAIAMAQGARFYELTPWLILISGD